LIPEFGPLAFYVFGFEGKNELRAMTPFSLFPPPPFPFGLPFFPPPSTPIGKGEKKVNAQVVHFLLLSPPPPSRFSPLAPFPLLHFPEDDEER